MMTEPAIPTTYHGVPIPEAIRAEWDDVDGLGWRMGVDREQSAFERTTADEDC
ncbi:MAG: hypothetical protein ACRDPR_20510 [Nocardioidaceae bacterium]